MLNFHLSLVAASSLSRSFTYVKEIHATDNLCRIYNSLQGKFKVPHPDFVLNKLALPSSQSASPLYNPMLAAGTKD